MGKSFKKHYTAPRSQEIGDKSMARALIHRNLSDMLLSVKRHFAFFPIPSPQAQKWTFHHKQYSIQNEE